MKYRIFYHHGPELGLSTRVEKGQMDVGGGALTILNKGNSTSISFCEIKDIQLIRLHKVGRVIRIEHSNGVSFFSVVRFMIGQFAIINFFKTGKLFEHARDAIRSKPAAS